MTCNTQARKLQKPHCQVSSPTTLLQVGGKTPVFFTLRENEPESEGIRTIISF